MVHTVSRRSIRGLALIIAAWVALAGTVAQAGGQSRPTAPATLHMLAQDEAGITLEVQTPAYTVRHGGAFNDQLTAPGLQAGGAPGAPRMPVATALLAVPPGVAVTLKVVSREQQPLTERLSLAPVPQPVRGGEALQPGQMQPTPDTAIYESDRLYPAPLGEITADGWWRDQRVVRVELYPFQYNPASGVVVWHRTLRAHLAFAPGGIATGTGTLAEQTSAPMQPPAPFDMALQQHVLNYAQAAGWRGKPAPPAFRLSQVVSPTATRYRVGVEADGLYRISRSELQAAGLDVDNIDPRLLQMSSQGQPVALLVTGEQDGSLDVGDTIFFYGQRFRGTLQEEKYTRENVYWLAVGDTPGSRMTTVDGTPDASLRVPETYTTTVRAEESQTWFPSHFTNQETWFWQRVQAGTADSTSRTYSVNLTGVESEPFTATVRGEIVAITFARTTTANYHTRFRLNNELVADDYWGNGFAPTRHTFTGGVPQSALREGNNQLQLTILGDAAVEINDMLFDWFDVTYRRTFTADQNQLHVTTHESGTWQYQVDGFVATEVQVFDISNPLAPVAITNPRVAPGTQGQQVAFAVEQTGTATYLAVAPAAINPPARLSRYEPPDLRDTSNQADYLMISHSSFITDVQRLATYRTRQGLQTRVVDIADLYNLFNDGIYHPVAIKNFLEYAYFNWQAPAPTYVLLVGDGHWNMLGHAPAAFEGGPVFLPPNLEWVDPFQGETDTANRLVTIVGSDTMPDMMIGRMPVNTSAELNAIIDKTLAYEQQGSQDWHQHVTFVADNVPDVAGNFITTTETLIQRYIPITYTTQRMYLNDYCGAPGEANRCTSLNTQLVNTLNTTGTLFLAYNGHSSIDRWASEGILTLNNIEQMTNNDQLTLLFSMTCLDGYWQHPVITGIAETMVRASNGGAVATFSPTGLGVATGHDVMQDGMFDAILNDDAQTLGEATLASKARLFRIGRNLDLLDTFMIHGDPALRLPTIADVPPQIRVYLPLVRRE